MAHVFWAGQVGTCNVTMFDWVDSTLTPEHIPGLLGAREAQDNAGSSLCAEAGDLAADASDIAHLASVTAVQVFSQSQTTRKPQPGHCPARALKGGQHMAISSPSLTRAEHPAAGAKTRTK